MKRIKNLYYAIWADLIWSVGKNAKWKSNKTYILFIMSFLFGLNYYPFLLLLPKIISPFNLFKDFILFNNEKIDMLIRGLIILLVPGYILNYFLIFYKDKYKKIIYLYKSQNLKYFFKYLTTSIIIPIALLILVLIIKWIF